MSCTECGEPDCPGVIVCPVCGCGEHGEEAETHVIDHGMCWACLKRWQAELNGVCEECGNPFDDNPGKTICKTCQDWLVEDTNA